MNLFTYIYVHTYIRIHTYITYSRPPAGRPACLLACLPTPSKERDRPQGLVAAAPQRSPFAMPRKLLDVAFEEKGLGCRV